MESSCNCGGVNHEGLWSALEELMAELRAKGISIPQEVVQDLASARTMTAIYRRDPTVLTTEVEVESYLAKIEPALLYLAESAVGREYADSWQERINASRSAVAERPARSPKFVPGVPKGQRWIRINVAGYLNEDEVGDLLARQSLSAKPQEDGYLLVYGSEGNVKDFVKEVRRKIGGGNQ